MKEGRGYESKRNERGGGYEEGVMKAGRGIKGGGDEGYERGGTWA